jgi:beta-glucosidase/6-phospho-beta-glucosidase/beta-galactosidase
MLMALVLGAVTSGCVDNDAASDDAGAETTGAGDDGVMLDYVFPEDFGWGVALAGFQSEPGCPNLPAAECEDRNSDWYQWVTDPELVADTGTHNSGDPLSDGPGMWETYEEDFSRAADELSLTTIRISLEWSRLFPDAAAEEATSPEALAAFVDPAAVARYHEVLQAARARGLEPMVTLNHYTLPLWLHDGKACKEDLDTCVHRGWVDLERIVPAIRTFSGYCAAEFGAEVDLWATINEPMAVVISGYLLPSAGRTNPPGVSLRVDEGVDVMFNMAEAHAQMYAAVHEHDGVDANDDGVAAMVGPVPNLAAVEPVDPNDPNAPTAVLHADHLYNWAWLNAAIRGEFDRNLDGEIDETIPAYAGSADFIGVNYYTKLLVEAVDLPVLSNNYPWFDFFPNISDLFNTYPKGLEIVLTDAHERFGLPLYITENGTEDMTIDQAEEFLKPHLASVHRAMEAGADVRGFYWWTLVDNYEWNHGMNLRFGLFGLEGDKSRTLRPVGATYADIAAKGGF